MASWWFAPYQRPYGWPLDPRHYTWGRFCQAPLIIYILPASVTKRRVGDWGVGQTPGLPGQRGPLQSTTVKTLIIKMLIFHFLVPKGPPSKFCSGPLTLRYATTVPPTTTDISCGLATRAAQSYDLPGRKIRSKYFLSALITLVFFFSPLYYF